MTPSHSPLVNLGIVAAFSIKLLLQLAEEWVGEPWLVDSFCELRPLCSQQSLKFLCTWWRGAFKGCQGHEGQQSQSWLPTGAEMAQRLFRRASVETLPKLSYNFPKSSCFLSCQYWTPSFWHSLWVWQGWHCLAQPVCWLKTTQPSFPLSSCHCQGLVRPWLCLSRISWTV